MTAPRGPWFDARAAKGTKANPLTPSDLPFTVTETRRHWFKYAGAYVLMPESPKGAVLAVGQKERT